MFSRVKPLELFTQIQKKIAELIKMPTPRTPLHLPSLLAVSLLAEWAI